MRRTQKPKANQKKLLVSTEKIRSLEPTQLRDVAGGACPTTKPVEQNGGGVS